MMRCMKVAMVLAGGTAAALVWAATASAATITVAPTTASPGSAVVISGDVLANGQPGCPAGDAVTLISGAFVGHGEFAGQPAVEATTTAQGTYSTSVTLATSLAPGTYEISGRCGGGNLGVTAALTVAGLAPTGPGIGGHSPESVAVVAASLLLIGTATCGAVARPRRATHS